MTSVCIHHKLVTNYKTVKTKNEVILIAIFQPNQSVYMPTQSVKFIPRLGILWDPLGSFGLKFLRMSKLLEKSALLQKEQIDIFEIKTFPKRTLSKKN